MLSENQGPYPVWPKIGLKAFLRQSEKEWHKCPECEAPMRQDDGERLPCPECVTAEEKR